MKKRWLAAVSMAVIALFLAESAPVTAGGSPFNASIARSKKGKYKSAVIDVDLPESNPQQQTRKIPVGGTAKFFIKIKNAAPSVYNSALEGDADNSDFDLSFFVNGEDVSASYNNDCLSTPIPAKGKVLIEMRVKATGATVGDLDRFAFSQSDTASCVGPPPAHDLVWAIVKVI